MLYYMPPRSRMTRAELIKALEQAEQVQSQQLEMFSTRIPANLKKRVKNQAIHFEGGTQAIVTQALEEFLNKQTD